MRRPRAARPNADRSAFAGFRFPPEVITVAVRWFLRYGLSYRDIEEPRTCAFWTNWCPPPRTLRSSTPTTRLKAIMLG
jgi:hypothetical protein